MNPKLRIRLQNELNLFESGIRSLEKFEDKLLFKALESTQKWRTGDRKYFKDSLKFFLNRDKREDMTKYNQSYLVISRDFFEKVKEENSKVLVKLYSKDNNTYNCEICGEKQFHSRLAHEWRNTKLILHQKADCGDCKDKILAL